MLKKIFEIKNRETCLIVYFYTFCRSQYYYFPEMYDDGNEPLLGSVRGSEEEALQEVPGGGRGRGGPGAQPHQPGQRVRDDPVRAR